MGLLPLLLLLVPHLLLLLRLVKLAYKELKEVDGLEISKEGVKGWEFAMKRCSSSSFPPPHPLIILVLSLLSTRYDKCIDCVETRIALRLRVQLGTTKNANEM